MKKKVLLKALGEEIYLWMKVHGYIKEVILSGKEVKVDPARALCALDASVFYLKNPNAEDCDYRQVACEQCPMFEHWTDVVQDHRDLRSCLSSNSPLRIAYGKGSSSRGVLLMLVDLLDRYYSLNGHHTTQMTEFMDVHRVAILEVRRAETDYFIDPTLTGVN